MKEIPEGMFYWCTELTGVTLPPKLEKIGYQAFHSCWALTGIELPGTLKEIGEEAFLNCRLTAINLPEGLLSIKTRAFSGCESLTDITLPKSVDTVEYGAFESCSKLTAIYVASGNPYYSSSDGVLYTLDGKILHTFPKGLRGGTYTVPKGVQGIGAYAFIHCKFDKLVLQKGVTDIGEYGVAGPISTIELPKSLKTIGDSNFYYDTLTDVYYAGSEQDWAKIQIGSWGNYDLDSATFHFGGEMSSGSFDGGNFRWELGGDGKLVIYGTGALPDFAGAEDIPWYSVREDITGVLLPAEISKIGNNAFLDCAAMTTVTLPGSLRQIGERAFYGCTALEHVIFQGSQEEYQRITIGKYNDPLKKAAKTYERMSDYLDNSAIVINGSGSAWAYYQASPNQTVKFTVGDTAGTATADQYGILRVPLGSFTQVGTHRVNIAFTQIGIHELDPAYVVTATVTVHSQSYTQNWKLSMGAEVGVGIGPGIPSNPIGLEANLFKVEGSVGAGVVSNISRSYSNGTNSLKLTTDVKAEAGAGVKSGITGDVNKVKFDLFSASAGVKGGVTGTYGIQIDNYSLSNPKQQMAVGTYLLEQVLTANPNTVIFLPFYGFLADTVYEETGSTVIYGSGASLTTSASVSGGALEVNGKSLFEAGKIGSSMAVSMSEQYNTKGEVSRNATFSAEKAMSFLTGGSIMNVENEGLGLKMLGTDFSVSYKKGGGKEAMEVSTLADPSSGMRMFLFGEAQSYDYMKYTFEGASLSELRKNSSAINSYVNGTNLVIGASDIINIAKAVSTGYAPIAYTRQTKDELVYAVPVDVAGYLGVDAKLKATVSYAESGEFDRETGYAIHDQLYTVSKSDMTQIPVDTEMTLLQIMTAGFVSLKNKAQEFFKSVAGKIKDGVDAGWAWVEGKAESAKDWTVEIISAAGDALGISYHVDVYRLSSEKTVLSGGIRRENASSGNYEFSKAATIGRAFYINVIDNVTGEPVADFGTDPMEFTIRYAAEDLEAAGLSALSAVVLDGQIAIYRYSDDGDYFEYVGGVNDLSAMTVTAQITKPGQYVLAVDSCAPELRALNLSDFRQTPTIEANLDDLTGLDTSRFVFMLDGVVKVDSTNISEYYNSRTGVFTYTVSESDPLAEGEHTVSFTLADTSGNMDTYEYRFPVDLTAPDISDVTVEGAVNVGTVVEIRAQVSDQNLTSVQALLSKRLPDGSWSDEVSTEMGDMGNGLWGIDYEGDGSSIRVRICAEDIAANQTCSDVLEAKPFVESVRMEQEYLALRIGQSKALNAEVKPAELSASLQWSVEEGGENVICVDAAGNVTVKATGTAYVLAEATDGEVTLQARCRVDVAESLELSGVKLSTEKATVELYSTNYTGLDILLMLPQNYKLSDTGSDAQEEAPGAAISDAYFTDPKIAELFGLKVCDDRSVQIVPSADAINAAGSVGKKYTGTVTVVVEGKTYETGSLTLNVKKTQPKVKLKVGTFNSFYSGQSQTIQVSGATVTGINADSTKENPLPAWLALHNGELSLTEAAPQKAASGKAYLEIWTEEWAVPVRTALSVKNSYQAPKLKLSVSSVQLSSYTGSSEGVKIRLMPKNKKESLEGLKVCGIAAPAGYSIADYADDGTFTLKAEKGFSSGKINLEVSFSDTGKTVNLPVTVKSTQVKLKLAKTGITLNAGIGDSALINITATPKDFVISAPTIRLTDSTGADKLGSGELEVRYESGAVRINTTAQTPDNAKYNLSVEAGGSQKVTLKIETINKTPTVSLKQGTTLDLSFPEQAATVNAVFKNYAGGKISSFRYSITEMKGKEVLDENAGGFCVESDGGSVFKVSCSDPAQVDLKNSYTLKLKMTLADGNEYDASVKLKLKKTAVKVKLSTTKLTLNKAVGDVASVTVSCTTKGYVFTEPYVQLMDRTGKLSADGKLGIAWVNGKLEIRTTDATEYETTYKLLISAEKGAAPTTLTVTIPAAIKSTVTATLKVKGTLDVIRDGSAVTVTPAYKNCAADTRRVEKLIILDSANTDVTALFRIDRNANGTYTVTKAKGAQLELTQKYQAKLLTTFGDAPPVESKPVKLTVKMGTAKLTPQIDGTLFTDDRNSRMNLSFTSVDSTLNTVAKVEIKEAKYADLFEIYKYENGQFGIGFADEEPVLSKKPITLTLNVYLAGNYSAKVNTTVKIKVTVVG